MPDPKVPCEPFETLGKVTTPLVGYRPPSGLAEADFAEGVAQSIFEIKVRCGYVK